MVHNGTRWYAMVRGGTRWYAMVGENLTGDLTGDLAGKFGCEGGTAEANGLVDPSAKPFFDLSGKVGQDTKSSYKVEESE